MVQKNPTSLLKTTSPDAPVDSILLNKALAALLKNHEKTAEQGDKSSLLGSDLPIQVQFNLMRVPEKPSSRPICIDIPHPLHRLVDGTEDEIDGDGLEDVEVCLIVKDEAKPWVLDLIQKFPSHLSYIKKVLTLTSLRKKHSQYADRRELVRRYDLFLADDRILPMLGKALGKSFFQQKKQPVPIKLTRKEALPFAVKRCLRGTFMWVSAGTCLTIKAGNTAMPTQNLAANIEAIVKQAASHIPRKWGNIASISMKTSNSMALPIYNKTREDLEEIAELAQVNNEKKRELETQSQEEIQKEKKQKVEKASKSPLLKALKVLKTQEDKDSSSKSITDEKKKRKTTEEILLSKSSEKKKTTAKSKEKERSVKTKKQKVVDTGAAASKSETKSKIKDKKTVQDSKSTEKKEFVASRKFAGSKDGYVFYKGSEGVGYYIDIKPVVTHFERVVSHRGREKKQGRSKSPGAKRRKSVSGRRKQ